MMYKTVPNDSTKHVFDHHSDGRLFEVIMYNDKMLVCKINGKTIWVHKDYKYNRKTK